jgi:redox-sensitive bicupin YhaK (pirin superfamily)
MMQTVRHSEERGAANLGWLDSRHTFSFGHYHDPRFMGFGPLRVINEDHVQPARGFDTHGHRDMEIITYMISGALRHEDSMGNGSVIRPGDVQRMTAGSGIRHSEHNATDAEEAHLLQIWIEPETVDLPPGYEQKAFSAAEKANCLRLVVSRDGRDGSVIIHRDADIYAGLLERGASLTHEFAAGRLGWLQVVRGTLTANGLSLRAGDGLSLRDTPALVLQATSETEVLLFDMV